MQEEMVVIQVEQVELEEVELPLQEQQDLVEEQVEQV
jgi:hypothetical protein